MGVTYKTRAKIAVAAGLLILIGGILPLCYPYPLHGLGWVLVVTGSRLSFWGCFTLARDKGVQLPAWSRWLLALPAAAATYLSISGLAYGILTTAEYLLTGSVNPGYPDYPFLFLLLLIANVPASYACVLAGARTAPRHRLVIAIPVALTCLYIEYVALVSIAMSTFGDVAKVWTWPVWWIIAWVLGMVTVIWACVRVRRFERSGESLRDTGG